MSYAIAGMVLTLAASALAVAPAKALTAEEQVNAMYGHPLVKMLQEMNAEAVAIGTVAGQAGDVLSIKFVNPRPVTIDDTNYYGVNITQPNWHVVAGDDVILAYKDGKWMYIADAQCEMSWITHLDLKAVPEVQTVSIDWGESQPVALPPVEPRTVSAPAPMPEPIRGMW